MRRQFQRARAPEEKEVRRRAILKAARRLMEEVGTIELSLSELARASGVSKPNIYRYFESREEVLLQVWVEEVRALTERLEQALQGARVGAIAPIVSAIVKSFEGQQRLCELTSVCSSVLERNLSVEAIVTSKTTLHALVARIAELLHRQLPAVKIEDCGWAASTIAAYVAGMWPGANPGPAVAEALKRPELAGLAPVFDRDFRRFLEVLFKGLA